MNILITGVGGPTPRSFAISLKKYSEHKNVRLIGTDINPLAIGLYRKDLFDKSYIVPRATDENYWDSINEIIKKESIDYAVILPELEVLVWADKQENGGLPCSTLLPNSELSKFLVDKSKMTSVLEPYDLVPKSVEFTRDVKDFSHIFEKLGEQFWVRSSSGTSGLGSLLIDSVTSLQNWIQINPNVNDFLASTYLPGRNLACKLLYWNGKLVRSACAERVNYIMAKVAPSGITGNTSFGRLLNEPDLVDVASKAMDIMFKETGAPKHGFFTADFKEDEDGKPYITEVNVRHVAFTQCFAAGGANFAADTITLLSNPESFDMTYKMYEFAPNLIFLRDVDDLPILMNENDLLSK